MSELNNSARVGNHQLSVVLDRIPGARRLSLEGGRYRAKCPSHDGKSDTSLSITVGDKGQVLLYCFGGCRLAQILDAIGLDLGDLYPDGLPSPKTKIQDDAAEMSALRDALRHELYVVLQVLEKDLWPQQDVDRGVLGLNRIRKIIDLALARRIVGHE